MPLVSEVKGPDVPIVVQKPPRRRRRPYRYKNVVLGRKPTALEERLLSLTDIPTRLTLYTGQLTETLVLLRQDQLARAVNTSSLPDITGEVRQLVWSAVHEAAGYGAAEHNREWARQGVTITPAPHLIEGRLDFNLGLRRHLHARCDGLQRLWTEFVSATEERLRGARRMAPEEWRSLSGRAVRLYLPAFAASIVNTGFAFGRTLERHRIRSLADGPETLVFTSVLDANTCGECEDADGTEFTEDSDEADEYAVPYFRCESVASGENRCRCIWVAVGSEPGWVNAKNDHIAAVLSLRDEAVAHQKEWDVRGRKEAVVSAVKKASVTWNSEPDLDVESAARNIAEQFAHPDGEVSFDLTADKFNTTVDIVSRTEKRADDGMLEDSDVRHVQFEVDNYTKRADLNYVAFDHPVSPKVARATLRTVMDSLTQLGATRMRLWASMSDGGYLWARLGFRADDPEKFADSVRHNFVVKEMEMRHAGKRDVGAKLEVLRAAVEPLLKNLTPDLPQRLADLKIDGEPVGKLILRGTDWHGAVEINSPDFQRRLNHFLGAKALPAAA